ncbi:MAG: hypothetical protein D6715_14345 [Calditrichaeota bacterium]|nr:MAG: hypothetical protein D6715_14345 [Calditrichota bacterium]
MYCLPQHSRDLWRRARLVRAIFMDVDGVLTAGEIAYDTRQQELKIFNALDGQGIKLARMAGLALGLISARESEAIRYRAGELGIPHLYLGVKDKLAAFQQASKALQLPGEAFCFIGDDLPDLPVLNRVGLPVAVANAAWSIQDQVPFRTRRRGGQGAVREVIEFVLHAQNRLEAILGQFGA